MRFRFTVIAGLLALIVLLLGRQFLDRFRAPKGLAERPVTQQVDPAAAAIPSAVQSGGIPSLLAPAWVARNKSGIVALEKGDFKAAAEHFAACLAERPDEVIFAHNLAETYARWATSIHTGDLFDRKRSIELLEEALQLHPERLELADLLARYERSEEAEDGFYNRETLHFQLAFDLTREELQADVETLVEVLENAYQEYGEWFVTRPADHSQPIRVVIYTQEGFSQVTRVGAWAGGIYDGTIRVPVTDLSRELPRVLGVLRHELLHAFVHVAGGASVPGWLNEGLAQWLENGRAGPDALGLERARKSMGGAQPFPLERLNGSLASWTDPKEVERAYAQSLLFVAYLEENFGADLLHEMIQSCAQGKTPHATFKSRVALDLDSILPDVFQ